MLLASVTLLADTTFPVTGSLVNEIAPQEESELVVVPEARLSDPLLRVTAPSERIDTGPPVTASPLPDRVPKDSTASGNPYPPLLSAPAG